MTIWQWRNWLNNQPFKTDKTVVVFVICCTISSSNDSFCTGFFRWWNTALEWIFENKNGNVTLIINMDSSTQRIIYRMIWAMNSQYCIYGFQTQKHYSRAKCIVLLSRSEIWRLDRSVFDLHSQMIVNEQTQGLYIIIIEHFSQFSMFAFNQFHSIKNAWKAIKNVSNKCLFSSRNTINILSFQIHNCSKCFIFHYFWVFMVL